MIKIVSPWFIRNFRERFTAYNVSATTFLPFVVIFKSRYWANNPDTVNHEAIHGRQMIECLLIGSWILVWWWSLTRKEKWIKNPLEKEAHDNEKNLDYLKKRKPYAWTKYL